MADNPVGTSEFSAEITIGSLKIDKNDIIDLVVTTELNLPDAFVLTLGSSENVKKKVVPKLKLHDLIDCKIHFNNDLPDLAFKGELTSHEPSNKYGSKGYTELRGYNSMHGLTRGKRSFTYLNQTDKEILEKVLQRNSQLKLSAEFCKEPPKIKHEHVYQANKSDLQFILDRATRSGYHVFVRDDKLHYKKRNGTPEKHKLKSSSFRKAGDDKDIISMEGFTPRLSTSHQVTQVIVRTWNPKTRKELIGKAPKDSSGGGATMGGETGKKAIEERYPDSIMVHTKTAFYSQDDGDAVAQAILDERLLSYVTAEGNTPGDPRLKPGQIVEVECDNKQFDGKYFITSVTHRYRSFDGSQFQTLFAAKRDAVEAPDDGSGSEQA
jgi:phage protein D